MFCLWVVLKISCIRKHKSSKQNAKNDDFCHSPSFFFLPGWSTMTQLWVVARHKVEENCRTLTTESSVIIYWRHVKCPLLQDRLTPLLGLSMPAYCSKADALSTPQSTPVSRSICPIQSPFCLRKNELQKSSSPFILGSIHLLKMKTCINPFMISKCISELI